MKENKPYCGIDVLPKAKYRKVRITDYKETKICKIPVISIDWTWQEYLWMMLVRIGFSRNNYMIKPGLYAVGNPNEKSQVLVSANYKFSFDVLRRELKGIDAWILVIDTKGINVWCSAGAGSFGTENLVMSIHETNLHEIISHRQIILPQLSATGVAAHLVLRDSDFRVIYGPVRAIDIPQFINNGFKADKEMRLVRFDLKDRLAVSWLEFVSASKKVISISLITVFMFSIKKNSIDLYSGIIASSIFIISLWISVLSGTFLTAILLPYIPVRAFAVKGVIIGLASSFITIIILKPASMLSIISIVLFITGLTSYLALNYTGCSTFTSLSGVQKETKIYVPVIMGLIIVSGIIQFVRMILYGI